MDWAQLLESHGRIVWKTVYRLVNDEAEAADCFQETFVAALLYSRSHPIQNWPGLLKRLATAKAIDHLRRRVRTGAISLCAGSVENAVDGARSPHGIVESRELAERVRVELAALPQPQAEACCLRFLEGWAYDEVIREVPAEAKPVPEKMIDNRRVLGFVFEEHGGGYHWKRTYWVAPETKLPVRIEISARSDDKRLGPSDWVQTGFVFDEKLDTALFSTTPPADYQVETQKLLGIRPPK